MKGGINYILLKIRWFFLSARTDVLEAFLCIFYITIAVTYVTLDLDDLGDSLDTELIGEFITSHAYDVLGACLVALSLYRGVFLVILNDHLGRKHREYASFLFLLFWGIQLVPYLLFLGFIPELVTTLLFTVTELWLVFRVKAYRLLSRGND